MHFVTDSLLLSEQKCGDMFSYLQTLEISGRFKVLLGQAMKADEPPLAMFALCCPFGPLPLLDVPPRDYTFKSKHKMDMSPLSMDPRLVAQ